MGRLYESEQFDRGMAVLERTGLAGRRRALVSQAQGRVLEVGAGTGFNGFHYPAGAQVVATDINQAHLQVAQRKAATVRLACADAQQLPFSNESFDAVVGTLVFCSIRDASQALQEVRRVLRPHGRLWLLEHVRGPGRMTRRLTDWLEPLWFALQGECHLNRETAQSVAAAGFEVRYVDQSGWWGLLAEIHAVKPG